MLNFFTTLAFLLVSFLFSPKGMTETFSCKKILTLKNIRRNSLQFEPLSVSELKNTIGELNDQNLAEYFRTRDFLPSRREVKNRSPERIRLASDFDISVVFSLRELYLSSPYKYPFLRPFVKLDSFIDILVKYYNESVPLSTETTNKKNPSQDLQQARAQIKAYWANSYHGFRRYHMSNQLFKKSEFRQSTFVEVAELNSTLQIYTWMNGELSLNFGWRHELSSVTLEGIIKEKALLSGTERARRGLNARHGESQISTRGGEFEEVWVSSDSISSMAEFAWVTWFDQFPVSFAISKELGARPSFIRHGPVNLITFKREFEDETQWVMESPVPISKIDFVFTDRAYLEDPLIKALPKRIRRISYQAVEFIEEQIPNVARISKEKRISPQEAMKRILAEIK